MPVAVLHLSRHAEQKAETAGALFALGQIEDFLNRLGSEVSAHDGIAEALAELQDENSWGSSRFNQI